MSEVIVFDDVIEEIAARLDLREPNKDAVRSLNAALSQYYDVEGKKPPFEAVIDSATGVGKTYIMTAAMELFVNAYGIRDFVVITPGSTILGKTKANFTPGDPKSLTDPLSFRPVIITADNFATPAMRAAMGDDSLVKIYLFTVQSLIRPTSKTGRKTHEFQEGLGTEFYAHLKGTERLATFADEHHAYYGKAFSGAVRDLDPWVLVGLTATPHKKTPPEQIIFRYPLAAAIADRLVKTPVIVGRKDDRTDALTKLTDGITLLRSKEEAIVAYAAAGDKPMVNPVMLVVAKDIADADEYGSILRSDEFFGGAYQDAVLVVHSSAADEALAALARVEEPDSPVRIIISVGMLKEGWDVKNVYVVASLRASVSEILTEQTLGRGMRLPYGAYTDVQLLDTLEVVAHESYDKLLRAAGVLNQAFVDYRTWVALRPNAKGEMVAVTESSDGSPIPIVSGDLPVAGKSNAPPGVAPTEVSGGAAVPSLFDVENRTKAAMAGAAKMKEPIHPRPDGPAIQIPMLKMTTVKSTFTLADITDHEPFRRLGKALATNPAGELRRTLVGARVVVGLDGIKRTELIRSTAVDRIRSTPTLFPIEALRRELAEIVLSSPNVPARASQRAAVEPILDAFLDGLGSEAERMLSANLERAGFRLVRLVADAQRQFTAKPSYEEIVNVRPFSPVRVTDKVRSTDRVGPFKRSIAYEGWACSMFPVAWFDSEPERRVANMVDENQNVTCWTRLHTGDVPILWNSEGQQYNPDLIVIEADGTHSIVEIKMDKQVTSSEVQAKREAARRWANHVNADEAVKVKWQYLLVSETDINMAKNSWPDLKALAS